MLIVLVPEITPRIQYVMDFIFRERKIEFRLLCQGSQFDSQDTILTYGCAHAGSKLSIDASGLLFESSIRVPELDHVNVEGESFLRIDGVFDPVAAIFYVLSRYEEYVCEHFDEHGRFPAEQSIQFKFKWLDKCMCDRWAMYLIRQLEMNAEIQHAIVPSFDIDNTYAFRLKGVKRSWLSFGRDLLRGDFARVRDRIKVKRGGKDPYDTFNFLETIAEEHKTTRFFWLVAPLGPKDRNISIENIEHRALVQKMDRNQQVGLHPGYASNSQRSLVQAEKESLEIVLGRDVKHSRQHFLRFRLPETYEVLEACAFDHEYSMGFAELVGFRNGTARPFPWFNLKENRSTELMVHPFAYMDGTLNEYMQLSPELSCLEIKKLYDEVCQYGGDFVFIWHNETVGNFGKWRGWKAVLDYTLNLEK